MEWLDAELAARGWRESYLASMAGIPRSVIIRARSGTMPKWEACTAIAAALQLPPKLVLRKAGLLSPAEETPGLEEWMRLRFRKLKPTPLPIRLPLFHAALTFICLSLLPPRPLAIPTAAGIALIIIVYIQILAYRTGYHLAF